nr:Chain C, 8-Mer peptide from Protein Nef [Human immunodeficiency virus 1]4WU5_F Chain F, 8-Mer peptide from Protein Nef [Human immunodeficiency virus 1]5HGB_C Chain C, Protein Nef [Human immunodeficiency virus type 1 (NDK ISOLATE)]5HGB_F Chain F, Protein Nef [Human immunodeficiency virus type 1 (NDK ISOLATE)]5HGB_I Chain I, Protein Nef [Human immunodeficiency virus type 1 (NDK ISOLATE)]5HGB_L Chain L, Protein Nef [Human immunodeficiency virus type 1 (NDK ISOLATE)]7K80_C Chain C, ARG-TYR-PRO
RYPLTFGW